MQGFLPGNLKNRCSIFREIPFLALRGSNAIFGIKSAIRDSNPMFGIKSHFRDLGFGARILFSSSSHIFRIRDPGLESHARGDQVTLSGFGIPTFGIKSQFRRCGARIPFFGSSHIFGTRDSNPSSQIFRIRDSGLESHVSDFRDQVTRIPLLGSSHFFGIWDSGLEYHFRDSVFRFSHFRDQVPFSEFGTRDSGLGSYFRNEVASLAFGVWDLGLSTPMFGIKSHFRDSGFKTRIPFSGLTGVRARIGIKWHFRDYAADHILATARAENHAPWLEGVSA